jgi:hypothetical protein
MIVSVPSLRIPPAPPEATFPFRTVTPEMVAVTAAATWKILLLWLPSMIVWLGPLPAMVTPVPTTMSPLVRTIAVPLRLGHPHGVESMHMSFAAAS